MARDGVTKLYTATPGGATQGTDLRAWMAANLTELNVGGMYTFGSGTSERNYWTLTFPLSGAEIMVCCPNGTSMARDNLYVDLDTREGNWTQALVLVYAIQGGLEDALFNGVDPDTSAFTDHVVTTLGLPQPGKGIPMLHWLAGTGAAHQLHIIEDDTQQDIIFTLSRTIAGANYMSTAIFSDRMFVEYPALQPTFSQAGFVFIGANNVIQPNKTLHNFCAGGWLPESNTPVFVGPALNTLPFAGDTGPAFDQIASGRYPLGGVAEDWAAELWVPSNYGWMRCNPLLVRLTGQNNPRFNQKQGDDTDFKFIKHIQRFLTPWDDSQAEPT